MNQRIQLAATLAAASQPAFAAARGQRVFVGSAKKFACSAFVLQQLSAHA